MQRFGFALFLLAACAPSMAEARHGKSRHEKIPIAPEALAGELVPASAPSALLLESAQAASGIVALLTAAAQVAPSLAPNLVSQDLTRSLGFDPLSANLDKGLAAEGPRAIVVDPRALGFSAPVADEARAKAALQAWLSQLGPVRPTRGAPLKGPLASGGGEQVRAGMIAPVAGSLRVLTASGRNAAALVSQLAHLGRKEQDTQPLGGIATIAAALTVVPGPVRLWSRGEAPVLGALVSIQAGENGLYATGLLLASAGSSALLDGNAPPANACDGLPLFCARGAPGPALRALAPLFARELIANDLLGNQRESRAALDALVQSVLAASRGPVLIRIEGLEARKLSEPEALLLALPSSLASGASTEALALPATLPNPWSALPAPRSGILLSPDTQLCLQSQSGALWLSSPCGPVPAHLSDDGGVPELSARFDTQALARSLQPLNALDALRGPLAAGAFAGKILWGDLFSHSGPIDLSARPSTQTSPELAGALDLTFAWPLSTAATAK